ncbi:hypothetical protein DFQ28_002880 [Apophysomyces sp. BC1034]|nr:hypothetical protein DFQ30_005497 [Apophysomyces sp. BC1015]KAG0179143.1 hypothetical protein DFQ29_002479 [Apophysomyces sp. BC1021]KAG0189805.1 hypothetical protein DFQ28_002880 [Apophysomyces sp. BC1034]
MADESSSSSSLKDLDSLLANQSPNTSDKQQEQQQQQPSASLPPAPTPVPVPATTSAPTTPEQPPLREDLLKSAVSFLSSPNVRSADSAKKIAFLKNKGLNQQEIDEAFKRVGETTTVEGTTQAAATAPTTTATTTALPEAPLIPARPAVHASTPPQIVYYPIVPPSMPVERVLATAIIFGLGAVGVTAGLVGIIRRLMAPVFSNIALFQRDRYNQQKAVADQIEEKLKEKDEGLEGEGEKSAIEALSEQQKQLAETLERVVARARTARENKTPYKDFQGSLTNLRNAVSEPAVYSSLGSFSRVNSDSSSPAVQAFKSEVRSLKGALLNRRNFPLV